jgi:hypothetical protein
MILKNQRPFCFTDWQAQQLKRIDHSLRKLNRYALDELRDIGRTTLTHAQYQKRAERVATIAIRMASALRVHEEILASGREQEPEKIEVSYVPNCENCEENGRPEKPDSDEDVLRYGRKHDPTSQKEVEDLLELAQRTEERVSARCTSRRAPPRALFSAISRLTAAVLRQQQLLRRTARKRVPEVEFTKTDTCPHCGARPQNQPANQMTTQ